MSKIKIITKSQLLSKISASISNQIFSKPCFGFYTLIAATSSIIRVQFRYINLKNLLKNKRHWKKAFGDEKTGQQGN